MQVETDSKDKIFPNSVLKWNYKEKNFPREKSFRNYEQEMKISL